MAVDPTQIQNLKNLFDQVGAKEQALADASDANDAAQSSAQAAIAVATGTASARVAAHDDLKASITAAEAALDALL